MFKYAALGAMALVLVACGSTPEERQIVATVSLSEACQAYGSALRVLATQRQLGELSPAQIDTVNQMNGATDEICGNPLPPADTLDAINRVNMAVTRALIIAAENSK